MTRKQRRKWHEAQTKKQIEDIKRHYPPEKVRELLNAEMTEEKAAATLGLGLTDFKILVTMYKMLEEI